MNLVIVKVYTSKAGYLKNIELIPPLKAVELAQKLKLQTINQTSERLHKLAEVFHKHDG
ncbi:MAG: hypothetical protein V7K38_09630 [Nostoc sp.]|uniref:hypothetical protein n=1 Tax=Nostoc sp. TaxID=1180 RepID=UPI002FF577E8